MAGRQLDGPAHEPRAVATGDPAEAAALTSAHAHGHDQVDGLTECFLGGVTEEAFGGSVPEGNASCRVGADNTIGRGRGDVYEARLARLLGDIESAQLHAVEDEIGQLAQGLAISAGEGIARSGIGEAKRADDVA